MQSFEDSNLSAGVTGVVLVVDVVVVVVSVCLGGLQIEALEVVEVELRDALSARFLECFRVQFGLACAGVPLV